MHQPQIFSSQAYDLHWSGIADSALRPALMVAMQEDGSGYRPVLASELFKSSVSGSVNVTGVVAVDAVGITGQNGLGVDVIPVNGLNSLVAVISSGVVVTSGNITVGNVAAGQSGSWIVGVTGANGLPINPTLVSGFNAIPVFLASGGLGGGSSSSTVTNIVAIKPALPSVSNVTYAINITGNGTFSNYFDQIPLITGSPVTLSIEPDSNNSDPIYIAFSGTATTGNAYELRGDKSIDVSGTAAVYFAQATGSNRVMVLVQAY
jgi:hypothetical protein